MAIKRLSTSSPNEANLLCQFRHRNIVQCLGAYFQAPDYVLVMEYAPENLKQAIRLHEISPSTLVEWSLAIATGMNYLHNEAPITVIHRDLKPANILVFPGGLLKVRLRYKGVEGGEGGLTFLLRFAVADHRLWPVARARDAAADQRLYELGRHL